MGTYYSLESHAIYDIGIDYGKGKYNIDKATGIRYGIIKARHVIAWHRKARTFIAQDEEGNKNIGFFHESDEMVAEQAPGDHCIMIAKSRFYTRCRFCDRLTPGAGDLSSPHLHGVKTYAFGYDWFSTNEFPYPLYDTQTNQPIERRSNG